MLVSLLMLATVAFGDTKTWTGAVSNLWSVGANWEGGVPPVSGDDLLFAPDDSFSPRLTTNDIAGLMLGSVTFAPDSVYTVNGNAITLSAGLTLTCCTNVTWNIPITLTASQAFHVENGESSIDFNSTIDLGGHTLTIYPAFTRLLGTISGAGNVNLVRNTDLPVVTTLQVIGSIAITGNASLSGGADLNVDGSIAAAALTAGAGSVISGDGTLPATTLNDATIRPGSDDVLDCCGDRNQLGVLTTGNLEMTGGAGSFNLVTPTPGSGHDQIAVNGTVTLNDPTLLINYPGALPALGSSFTIIANDGVDAVTGTFAGLPEGAMFNVGFTTLRITYLGGTGNDVAVMVVANANGAAGVPTLGTWMLLLFAAAIAAIGVKLTAT